SLAWGIDLIDWLGGEVTGNLVIHNRSGITNAYALKTDSGTRFEDVVISGNVLAFATGTGTPSVQLGDGVNVVYRDNTVVSPSNSRLVRLAGGGYTFAGTNRYVSGASQAFQVDGTLRTLAQWRSDTGDQGATGSMPAFPAPQRDLEGYAATLGLDGFQGLLDAFHAQSKATWNAALTAGAINDWLRAGYGMAPLQPRRVRRRPPRPPLPPPRLPCPRLFPRPHVRRRRRRPRTGTWPCRPPRDAPRACTISCCGCCRSWPTTGTVHAPARHTATGADARRRGARHRSAPWPQEGRRRPRSAAPGRSQRAAPPSS